MIYCRVEPKINSQCICLTPFIFNSNDTSYLTALLSHYFHMQLSPKIIHLSNRGTNVPIPYWFKSVSCLTNHCVTTASNWPSLLYLWSPKFCFSAGNRCYTFGARYPRCSHKQRRYFSYDVTRDVKLFSGWSSCNIIRPLHKAIVISSACIIKATETTYREHSQLISQCVPTILAET
jgi:hypothetical protein